MPATKKFPKQLFVAKEDTPKHTYFGTELEISKLMGFVDERGNLEVGVYELVEVKKLKLVEDK